jgi:hypothetical protein
LLRILRDLGTAAGKQLPPSGAEVGESSYAKNERGGGEGGLKEMRKGERVSEANRSESVGMGARDKAAGGSETAPLFTHSMVKPRQRCADIPSTQRTPIV